MSLRQWLKGLGLMLISGLVLAIYLALNYVLAGEYLTKVMGNDMPAFLNRVMLLSKSFPKYAFWNPQEAGGVALNYVYPPLASTVIIGLSKVTSLGIVAWSKILGFLSIAVFAFGVYVFVWTRWRVWVVGFLAGIFYLLSPIAYFMLFEWGFVAESIAMVWFPMILLFFDLWLSQSLRKEEGFKTRWYLGMTAMMLGLSIVSHPMVSLGAVMFMGLYGLMMAVASKQDWWQRLKAVIKGQIKLGLIAVVLAGFWLVPYEVYRRYASEGRLYGAGSAAGIYYNDVDFKHVLSFEIPETIEEKAFVFRHLSFPLALTYLLPVGLLMAWWLKKKGLGLAGLTAGVMLAMGLTPEILIWLDSKPMLAYFNQWRVLIYPCRVLMPAVAA